MLEMLYKRRSIREFKNIPLERERIEKITKAALLAPSSRGIRPWEFIIVESKQTLKLLSEAKASGSGFLADAPFAIVVIADEEKSDVWIEDTAISSIIIQLEAEKLGLVVHPVSVPIFVIVALSVTLKVFTPSPKYSRTLPTPPLTSMRRKTSRITSFADTQG